MDTLKCTECNYEHTKAEAIEYEYCTECEECLDIPDHFYDN